jgi:hypothetical protein
LKRHTSNSILLEDFHWIKFFSVLIFFKWIWAGLWSKLTTFNSLFSASLQNHTSFPTLIWAWEMTFGFNGLVFTTSKQKWPNIHTVKQNFGFLCRFGQSVTGSFSTNICSSRP